MIRTFVEGLGVQGPVVLVIEDMHWADPTSIQLLEHLLAVTEKATLLLVLTTRPEPDHPSRRLGDDARRRIPQLAREIRLELLGDDAQQAMFRALIGSDTIPSATMRRILQLAEGNPFYLEELIGSLVDEGALVQSEGGWRFDHEVEMTVPETVEKVVQARIDRLSPDVHQMLTAASVLGRSFGLPLLQGVIGVGGRVIDSVQELLRLGLFVEARRWPHAEYLFRHVLIQEAAYRTLTTERRIAWHRVAAQWLEQRSGEHPDEGVEVLARHWAAAGDENKAIDAFMRAGDLARRDHALDEAIDHYLEALPILERRGDRPTMAFVLFKLGLALHTSLRFAESNASYQRAFDLWDPPMGPRPTEVLRFGGPHLTAEPDPVRSYNLQDIQLQMALFDRLVDRRADDTLVPGLADRWEISDDGLLYRSI